MSFEDDVDDLYGVAPQDFLARRKELAASAKKRGDADAAKLIAATRKPTRAAWVVNVLVRADESARSRLHDLGDRLRTAHSAMDGARIRKLTSTQRRLIDDMVRTAFTAAGIADPSAALRDDVVGTLQAAIADPDVAARLGRLEKAEQWSGFGEFGAATAVGLEPKVAPKPRSARPEEPDASETREAELEAARERRSAAASGADAARAAHSDAVEQASERKALLAKARRRYEKLLESVDAAERALEEADEQFEAAERTAQEAAEHLAAAVAALDHAEREAARLEPPADGST